MALSIKCQACGNYYNGQKYSKCPYCGSSEMKADEAEKKEEKPGKSLKKLVTDIISKTGEKKNEQPDDAWVNPGIIEDTPKNLDIGETVGILPGTKSGEKEQDSKLSDARNLETDTLDLTISSRDDNVDPSMDVKAEKPFETLAGAIGGINRTIGKYVNTQGESVEPVVGWIIGVKGSDYGKAFSLKNGKNKIGRSDDYDVSLTDKSVSREVGLIISFDSRAKVFSALQGGGDYLSYINGEAVYERVVLKMYDEIEFGDSGYNKYIFVALCGENFDWSKYHSKEE